INIGADRKQLLRHTGELFRAMQLREEIKGSGLIRTGRVEAGLPPFHVHRSSKSLPELIQSMLRYSNNFIANQLFLACGARQSGYPATWDKGRAALAGFLHGEMGLGADQARVEEGSGLSRHNRVTPRAMHAILDRFKPYSHLLRWEKGRLVKSGTLTGVYSYAGYLPGKEGLDSFVLILNQPANNRDRLLELLAAIQGR
ncbi:MAG: D-alanyl-D-alanine carboxypeptidase, partial [Desulfobulbaceae bacterium]|nr:D-alanyl-D-alanine carboxypeptidase [Desulfobulbaceae bacterium]